MTAPKQSTADLLHITGFMLILCAIPVGILSVFQSRSEVHVSWDWAVVAGCIMAFAVGVIGGIFLLVSSRLTKKRREIDEKKTHDVVA